MHDIFASDSGYEYAGDGERHSTHAGFFVSVLLRYPEIGSVKYVPDTGCVVFRFMLHGALSKAAYRELVSELHLSLEVYSELSGRPIHVLKVDRVTCEPFSTVEITRDLDTLTPQELSLIVGFMCGKFADRLVYEMVDLPEADEMQIQDAMIEHMLDDVRQVRPRRDVIGFRERGRILLFRRGETKP